MGSATAICAFPVHTERLWPGLVCAQWGCDTGVVHSHVHTVGLRILVHPCAPLCVLVHALGLRILVHPCARAPQCPLQGGAAPCTRAPAGARSLPTLTRGHPTLSHTHELPMWNNPPPCGPQAPPEGPGGLVRPRARCPLCPQGVWVPPASGSPADAFWGKGFLSAAEGTASPDRKKTREGQRDTGTHGHTRTRMGTRVNAHVCVPVEQGACMVRL